MPLRADQSESRRPLVRAVLLVAALLLLSPPFAGAAERDDDLAFLSAILRNPDIPGTTRTDAAVRLLRHGGPGADAQLADSLRSGDHGQVEAVTRALAADGPPSPLVAEALLDAFADPPVGHGALAGRSLARLGDGAVSSIVLIAADPSKAPRARLEAISALGCFQNRTGVDALVSLLGADAEPAEVAAAMRSLREITRLELGEEPGRWRIWWEAVRSMPLDQAIGAASNDLEETVLEQKSRIDALQTERSELSDRLQLVLEQWFITLEEADRAQRLKSMLTDELAAVRRFAANQVQRMLRNGRSPDEQTVQLVTVLLDDRDRELRKVGAQLLAAMRVEGFPARLARAIATEADSEVAAFMLDQMALRPSPDAFEPVLNRLEDPLAAAAASRALVRLVDARMVPEDWASRSRPAIRRLHAETVTPATAALLILAGEDEDLIAAESALDHELAGVRRAAAHAFVDRARLEPVLARAGDEGIRPAAIEAFALVKPSLENLRSLQSLEPGESELPGWLDAVRRLGVRFRSDERIQVDDLLASDLRVPRRLRLDLLAAALGPELEGDGSDPVLRRMTELLAEDGRWQEVATVLGDRESVEDPILLERLFIARIRIEDYEGAQKLEDEPDAWIDCLSGSIESSPSGAALLISEIRRRFEDRLTEGQRSQLDELSRRVTLVDGTLSDVEGD